MPNPSPQRMLARVSTIAIGAKCFLVLRAAAMVLTVLIVTTLVMGMLDWTIRPRSVAIRWIASGAVLMLVCWGIFRWLWPAIAARFRLTDVAIMIEKSFPRLGDRLSSSIALLRSPYHAHAERSELERRVIEQASSESEQLRLSRVIDPWPTIYATSITAIVFCMVSGLALKNPTAAGHAVARLSQPWRSLDWPQRNRLLLETLPKQVHAGSDLTIALRDVESNELPTDARLLVRSEKNGVRTIGVTDRSGAHGTVAMRNIQASFDVRAVGGDDESMDWQSVTVVPTPQVTSSRWTLKPPSYTGIEPSTIEAARIKVAAGTTASLAIDVSQPIKAAILKIVAKDGDQETVEATVSANGMSIENSDILFTQDVDVRLYLVDENDLEKAAQSWHASVVQDAKPIVRWVDADIPSVVTPAGSFDIQWTAEDDYHLTQIGLTLRQQPKSETPAGAVTLMDDRVSSSTALTRQHHFTPADRGLSTGNRITLQAGAVDDLGQQGLSQPVEIEIVSVSELRDEITRREQKVVEKLRTATSEQRSARDQTLVAAGEINQDSSETSKSLRIAQTAQRETLRQLQGSGGAVQIASEMSRLLGDNGLQEESDQRIQELADVLENIARQDAADLASRLDALANSLPSSNLDDDQRSTMGPKLKALSTEQSALADKLESIMGELRQRNDVRDLSEQLADIRDDQQQLADETTMAGDAQREPLAMRQSDLTNRATRFATELEQLAAQMAGSANETAERLQRASERINDPQTIAEMRLAAEDLKSGRFGNALDRQQDVIDKLDSTEDALRGTDRRAPSAWSIVESLERIVDGQSNIVVRLETVDEDQAEQLADAQTEVTQKLEQLAGPLGEMPAFAVAIDAAIGNMRFVSASLRRKDVSQETKNAARHALTRLEHILAAFADLARTSEHKPQASKDDTRQPNQEEDADDRDEDQATLASVKLLLNLQQWLQERTLAVDSIEPTDATNRAEKRRLTRELAKEQLAVQQEFSKIFSQRPQEAPQ